MPDEIQTISTTTRPLPPAQMPLLHKIHRRDDYDDSFVTYLWFVNVTLGTA
jgi:hypothetical protein